jgi:hypothetical protein
LSRAILPALCVGLCASVAVASSPDDAQIFERIDSLKPVADAIDVDGDCSDWGAIPVFPDPSGDAGGDAARDITGVAIAPLDAALLVRIDVAGTPPTDAQDFWIEVDYRKQQHFDLKFSLSGFFQFFDAFPEVGEGPVPPRAAWSSHDVAAGSACVEARIDWALLDPQLPAAMQGQGSGAGARTWVRVRATTGEPLEFSPTEIDFGAAVGSFRLVETPYTLDPAPPPGAESPFETDLPLTGDWYLGQGSHGVGSHAAIPWGFDWHRVDTALEPESPERSGDLADNFSWGEPIHTGRAGTAGSLVVDDQPDCTPYQTCAGGTQVNFLFLLVPGDVGVLFSHSVPGSIPFDALDPVPAGALIGQVGNSGSYFSFPHLHHEARDTQAEPDAPIALAYTGVDVGLNTDLASDPWRRSFASWVPREGFFARRSPKAVPALPAVGWVALGALLAAAGAYRLARR